MLRLNPYYRPYWYSPYWYGSYGYGYWNGYWDGYIGGSTGYYPEHQNHYYGPRNPRGSSIIGNPEPRASRISSDDEIKNTYISGRASRTEGSSTITGDPNGTSNNRIIRPQDAQVSGTEIISNKGNEERTNIFSTSEPKPTTPEVSRNAENIKPQEPKEGTTTRSVVPISGRQQGNAVNNEKYSKPQQANKDNVFSRERIYAKPQSNDLERSMTIPKTYSAPNANRPRSSNEYVVPNSRNKQNINRSSESRQGTVTTPSNQRNFSTPSRSQNKFSQPNRSTSSPFSQPSRISTPSEPTHRMSTPSRSSQNYSAPSQSRSSGSYSAPSSSGRSSQGSSSSGSSSSSRGRR